MSKLKSFVWDGERKELTARAEGELRNFIIPFDIMNKDQKVAEAMTTIEIFIQTAIDKKLSPPKKET